MTEERRGGEGRKEGTAPLGRASGSAATIEPREMDSTAKDFSSSWMGSKFTPISTICVQKKPVTKLGMKFSY